MIFKNADRDIFQKNGRIYMADNATYTIEITIPDEAWTDPEGKNF